MMKVKSGEYVLLKAMHNVMQQAIERGELDT